MKKRKAITKKQASELMDLINNRKVYDDKRIASIIIGCLLSNTQKNFDYSSNPESATNRQMTAIRNIVMGRHYDKQTYSFFFGKLEKLNSEKLIINRNIAIKQIESVQDTSLIDNSVWNDFALDNVNDLAYDGTECEVSLC